MFKQITKTFPPITSERITEIKDDLNDEFLMTNSQELTRLLLDKGMDINLITKLVKNYIIMYKDMKKEKDCYHHHFTAENYINTLYKLYVK